MKSGTIGKLIAGGGALGIADSVAAHYERTMLAASGPVGAAISLIFGFLYGHGAGESYGSAAAGGAVTGAGSAFIGILVAFLMGDQGGPVLAGGTGGGAVAGAVGGLIGHAIGKKRQGGAGRENEPRP